MKNVKLFFMSMLLMLTMLSFTAVKEGFDLDLSRKVGTEVNIQRIAVTQTPLIFENQSYADKLALTSYRVMDNVTTLSDSGTVNYDYNRYRRLITRHVAESEDKGYYTQIGFVQDETEIFARVKEDFTKFKNLHAPAMMNAKKITVSVFRGTKGFSYVILTH